MSNVDKYLYIEEGTFHLEEREGVVQSRGTPDAGKIPALNSDGKLDTSIVPDLSGFVDVVIKAGETLADGDFVGIINQNSEAVAVKASRVLNIPAVGFVKIGAPENSLVQIFKSGDNSFLTNLNPGSTYFLDVNGSVTAAVPTNSGESFQKLGIAISTDTLFIDISEAIIRS